MSSKVDVVILAGAPAMAAPDGKTAPNRAMSPVAGKPMIQWELDAMRRSRAISRIYVVGDVQAEGIDSVIPATDTFIGNLLAGISFAAEQGSGRIMLATCDIPLITEHAIDDFIDRALDIDADFVYPIVTKADCLKSYPHLRRTYLRLREGAFTGGNMFLVSTEFVLRNEEVISRAYEARKQVFQLAGMIGWGTLIRVVIAQLIHPAAADIAALESAASGLLKGNIRALISSYAEIGEDVDNPEDLVAVEKLLLAGPLCSGMYHE